MIWFVLLWLQSFFVLNLCFLSVIHVHFSKTNIFILHSIFFIIVVFVNCAAACFGQNTPLKYLFNPNDLYLGEIMIFFLVRWNIKYPSIFFSLSEIELQELSKLTQTSVFLATFPSSSSSGKRGCNTSTFTSTLYTKYNILSCWQEPKPLIANGFQWEMWSTIWTTVKILSKMNSSVLLKDRKKDVQSGVRYMFS